MSIIHTQRNTKELGQYPTPFWVAQCLVERHFPTLSDKDFVIEPSCGPGSFLAAIPASVSAVGIDIDPSMASKARAHTGRTILEGDFRTIPLSVEPTVILGNPPFNLSLIDGFLDRAYALLPEGGQVAFILPAFSFQTASRVAEYASRWSLFQEMLPRNMFRNLSLPIVFARFGKDRRRTMVGFTLYNEMAAVQRLPKAYQAAIHAAGGSVWRRVVETVLAKLGGEADLPALYAEIEGSRPTQNTFWRAKIRQTLRRYANRFIPLGNGLYRLSDAYNLPAVA